MFNLPEAQLRFIENWINIEIEKYGKNKTVIAFNPERDHRFYQIHEDERRLFVISVTIEQITKRDVDYWMLSRGESIPFSSKLEISQNGERQFILLFIKVIHDEYFWIKSNMPEQLQKINNQCIQSIRQPNLDSRKARVNSKCADLSRLQEWNDLYPILLYQNDIKSIVSGTYRGFISNMVRHQIHGKNYEEITLELFIKKSKNSTKEIEQTVKLVNLYTMEDYNPLTYEKKNITINNPETINQLRENQINEIFKDVPIKFLNSFSQVTQITMTQLQDLQTERFSILEIQLSWTKAIKIGVFIGNGYVLTHNRERKFQIVSLDQFLEHSYSQFIKIRTFQEHFISNEEIQRNLRSILGPIENFSLYNSNYEHRLYAAVTGVSISPLIEQMDPTIKYYLSFFY